MLLSKVKDPIFNIPFFQLNHPERLYPSISLKLIRSLKNLCREGNGNTSQHSCLENPMDRGDWWATGHGVTKSHTWLSNWYYCLKNLNLSSNQLSFCFSYRKLFLSSLSLKSYCKIFLELLTFRVSINFGAQNLTYD